MGFKDSFDKAVLGDDPKELKGFIPALIRGTNPEYTREQVSDNANRIYKMFADASSELDIDDFGSFHAEESSCDLDSSVKIDINTNSLLAEAVSLDSYKVVKLLLAVDNIKVNSSIGCFKSPIEEAVDGSAFRCINLLLETGKLIFKTPAEKTKLSNCLVRLNLLCAELDDDKIVEDIKLLIDKLEECAQDIPQVVLGVSSGYTPGMDVVCSGAGCSTAVIASITSKGAEDRIKPA